MVMSLLGIHLNPICHSSLLQTQLQQVIESVNEEIPRLMAADLHWVATGDGGICDEVIIYVDHLIPCLSIGLIDQSPRSRVIDGDSCKTNDLN